LRRRKEKILQNRFVQLTQRRPAKATLRRGERDRALHGRLQRQRVPHMRHRQRSVTEYSPRCRAHIL